jgi:hypothetical protein
VGRTGAAALELAAFESVRSYEGIAVAVPTAADAAGPPTPPEQRNTVDGLLRNLPALVPGPRRGPAALAHQPEGATRRFRSRCCLVVDCGHSFTHIIPFVDGRPLPSAAQRVDVGGAVVTNHLKDLLTYRFLDLSNDYYIVEEMKHKIGRVPLDFRDTLAGRDTVGARQGTSAWPLFWFCPAGSTYRPPRRRLQEHAGVTYELPDFVHTFEGHVVRPEEAAAERAGEPAGPGPPHRTAPRRAIARGGTASAYRPTAAAAPAPQARAFGGPGTSV